MTRRRRCGCYGVGLMSTVQAINLAVVPDKFQAVLREFIREVLG